MDAVPGAPACGGSPGSTVAVAFVAQPAVFRHPEVGDPRPARLIDVGTLPANRARKIAVLVPAGMVELNEANIPFGEPPGQQTVGGEGSGLARV